MKNQATKFFKQVWTITSAVLRSKTSAVKSKAAAVRTRLIVLSLVNNKKFLFSTISQKFHSLLKHEKVDAEQASHVSTISNKFHALFGPRKLEVRHRISQKIHALLIGNEKEESTDNSKDIVVYNALLVEPPPPEECCDYLVGDEYGDEEDDEDDYPDLTHCLFDSEELELGNPNLSVVEIVKQSKDSEEDFVLEDEIDRVADLFIKRFHRNLRMQNQLSFKVYQDMLDKSV